MEERRPVDLFEALTGPLLPCEREDGFILAQKRSRTVTTGTLRKQVAHLGSFLDYTMTDADALGFELARWSPLIPVSFPAVSPPFCTCCLFPSLAVCSVSLHI